MWQCSHPPSSTRYLPRAICASEASAAADVKQAAVMVDIARIGMVRRMASPFDCCAGDGLDTGTRPLRSYFGATQKWLRMKHGRSSRGRQRSISMRRRSFSRGRFGGAWPAPPQHRCRPATWAAIGCGGEIEVHHQILVLQGFAVALRAMRRNPPSLSRSNTSTAPSPQLRKMRWAPRPANLLSRERYVRSTMIQLLHFMNICDTFRI